MSGKVLSFLVIITAITQVRTICHKRDDIYFYGIYGPLFIQNHVCSSSTLFESRTYIEQKLTSDSYFTLQNSNLGTLDPNVIPDSKSSRIIAMDIVNCGLKRIMPEAIRKVSKLYNLTISGNHLDSFNSSFIKHMNNRFQHLNLTNNNLNNVPNICLGLPTMKTIVLRNNPLKSIDSIMFTNCLNLLYLDLSNTSLETISDSAFTKLTRLNEFHLSNNNIKDSKQIYQNMSNLTLLDISYNEIDKFDIGVFNYYPNLKILNLGNNKLKSISVSVRSNTTLRQLIVNNNELSYINLTYFKDVQLLDLSYNKFDSLGVDFFEYCTDLRHLYLQHNQLNDLPVGIFSPMDDLKELDLSNNKLTNLDDHHLIPLKYLTELYLEGNELNSFEPYSVLHVLDNLKSFTLSNHDWSCEKLSTFLAVCRGKQINCTPREKLNFKVTNIQGISCLKDQPEQNTVYVDRSETNNAEKLVDQNNSSGGADVFVKYLYLPATLQKEQLKLYAQQIQEIHKLGLAVICITVVVVLFICFKVFSSSLQNIYSRLRNKRLGNPISINNVGYMSNMELLNPNNTQ